MIITFTDRKPDTESKITIGNRGDANINTIQFVLPKVYDDTDLTLFTASLEWKIFDGSEDIADLAITPDADNIILKWVQPKELMTVAGRGIICITLTSTDGSKIFRTDNIPIYVKDTINVDGNVLTDIPASYRVLIDSVELNKVNITKNTNSIIQNTDNISKNTSSIGFKANILQEDWINPTVLNGAKTLTINKLRYYKDTIGKVYVKGTLQNSNGIKPCIQLIDGYKSNIATSYFSIVSVNGNTVEKGIMLENGEIYITVPDGDTVSIDFNFKAK